MAVSDRTLRLLEHQKNGILMPFFWTIVFSIQAVRREGFDFAPSAKSWVQKSKDFCFSSPFESPFNVLNKKSRPEGRNFLFMSLEDFPFGLVSARLEPLVATKAVANTIEAQ